MLYISEEVSLAIGTQLEACFTLAISDFGD